MHRIGLLARHGVAGLVASACLLGGAPTATAGPAAPSGAALWVSRAVVTVIAYDASGQVLRVGGGVVLSSDGFIATNHHVIEGAARVAVELSGGQSLGDPAVFYSDARRDLAIVRGAAAGLRAPTLETSDWIGVAEPVLALPAARVPGATPVYGVISGFREDEGALRYIYIQSAELPSEFGGRPILNEAGALIGLSVGRLAGSTDLASAMPISDVRLALASARAELTARSDRLAGAGGAEVPPPGSGPDRERPTAREGAAAGDAGGRGAVGERSAPAPEALGPASVAPRPGDGRPGPDDLTAYFIAAPPPVPGPVPPDQIDAANRVRAKMNEIARQAHGAPLHRLDSMTQLHVYFEALRRLGIEE
jgi:S1-C subfamily serine protease